MAFFRSKVFQSIALSIIGVLIFYYSAKITDIKSFKEILPRANFLYLTTIIGFILLSHFIRAWRWQQLLAKDGVVPSLFSCFITLMTGYLANFIPPRAGEFIRAGLLARFEKIPFERVLGTIILERLVDLLMLAFLFGINVLLERQIIEDYVHTQVFAPLKEKLFLGFWLKMSFALGVVLIFFLFYRVVKKKTKFFQKLKNQFLSGLTSFFTLKNKVSFILATVIIWLAYWLINFLGFKALNLTIENEFGAALSLTTLGTIGMIITPGGTIYPLLSAGVLTLYGLQFQIGQIAGWLLWGIQIIIFLIFGLISFVSLPFLKKQTVN